jgi:hypothetical protein
MQVPVARFTVQRMMGTVALLAISIAGLRSPSQGLASVIFTLTTLILLTSVVCVAYHEGARRYFWLGFAVFGWGHQLLAVWAANSTSTFTRPILLTTFLFKLSRDLLGYGVAAAWRHVIDFASVSPYPGIRDSASWEIFHSLASLLIAYMAGLCTCRLFDARDRRREQALGQNR